eukprot:scaffold12289_cov112-Skeletonema_marinoi.AAC.1
MLAVTHTCIFSLTAEHEKRVYRLECYCTLKQTIYDAVTSFILIHEGAWPCCSACAVALKLSSLDGETAEDAGGRGRRNANPCTSIVELPSERSTSARIDSNEVVEVNEENNDGEGDDE